MILIATAGLVIDLHAPYRALEDRHLAQAMNWLDATGGPADRWVVAGKFDGEGQGPDLRAWGASAARLRYYVLRRRPASLAWSPPVEELPESEVIWLIVYRQSGPVPRGIDVWTDDYVAQAAARLGTATPKRFQLQPGRLGSTIEFQRFRGR